MTRSKFESRCAAVLKGCEYEPEEHIKEYTEEHKYIPDFVPKRDSKVLIECKGRFRTRAEASKYIYVRQCNPDIDIVFIFMAPGKPMPGAQRRKKCGTKQTHAEWAEKNNFKWYTLNNIPEEWCK